jgi:ABC-type phosphate transport system permease subunit
MAIAFPFALATAIYLCFYAKKGIFKTMVKSAVDILAGVPTVVVALFALAIFTLPQMGFLSVQVDTRSNALSRTELIFIYADEAYRTERFEDWDENILSGFEEFAESEGHWNVFGEWVEGIAPSNAVDGSDNNETEVFEFEQYEIRIAFENNLDINMTAQQCAELIRDTFNRAVAEKGISSDKISAEAVNGRVIIKVGESAAEPLIFYSSTSEAAEKVLGITPGEEIYPGETKEYIIDAPALTAGTVRSFGRSFLVAGMTMAVMVLPFVIKSMEEALKAVPTAYIDGALALGASKWRTIHKIVLRAARDGLVTGVILGMGRIVGDTAIVWLTLGGSIRMTGAQPWFLPENWLSTLRNGGGTLTTYIYWTSPAGEGNQFDVAFGASIVLIAIIILLNITAAVIGKAGIKKHG